jgi:drug/metabolite transporter (DMT)-like permease
MSNRLTISIPILFVFIYGSGFVGAKLGLPYSEPFTFLALRFFLAAIILGLIARSLHSCWRVQNLSWLLISGFLLQGVFSAGIFYALYFGMKPAVAALIIALQPLLVAVMAGFYLGEKVTLQRWVGLFVGIAGVSMVVADGLTTEGISSLSLMWCLFGLLGLTLGQLVQKKHCASMDLFVGGFIQSVSAGLFMGLFAFLFEPMKVIWSGEFIVALLWMGVGVSIGALTLLYIMLRRSSANQVASVFYGVPVAAALVAWPLFGQTPSWVDWVGFTVVACSILISNTHIHCRYPLWLRTLVGFHTKYSYISGKRGLEDDATATKSKSKTTQSL